MNGLMGIVLYALAAAICLSSIGWALADLSNIPDSCPRKQRRMRERPVLLRTGALLVVAGIITVVALNPILQYDVYLSG